MNVNETLNSVHEELLGSITNTRQKESLERIHVACNYLTENELKITPTSVEKYCRDRGFDGPKAQSIRNSKYVLLKYLNYRGSGQQLGGGRKKEAKTPVIENETIRAYVQLLEQQCAKERAHRLRIEAGLRKLPGISVDALISGVEVTKTVQAEGQGRAIPPELLAAVKVLFNEERLEKCGLEMHKGRIWAQVTHNVLLEKNELEALQKLL